jgi:predicted transcriptional regulator
MSKNGRQQGELESQILDSLWNSSEPQTSTQILQAVRGDGQLALTTVLTVLSRLTDKGLVQRDEANARGHLYRATKTREQHTAELMLGLFANGGDKTLALSLFAEGLNKETLASLRQAIDRD